MCERLWDWIGLTGLALASLGLVCGLRIGRSRGVWAMLRRIALSGMAIALGALCLGLWIALHSFEAFARSVPVAEVRCRWTGPQQFELTYLELRQGIAQPPRVFRMRGDQWSISGGIVKWHPWLTSLGLPSYHRPARISGRFSRTAEEVRAPPTAYALDGESDRVWWWCSRVSRWLPFVDAVYGSAAFMTVNPATRYLIEVTPSGYLIRAL